MTTESGTPDDRALAAELAGLRLFEGTPPEVLTHFANRLTLLPFTAGQTLYRQGDPGETFLLVIAGRLRVSRVDGNTERDLTEAAPGSILGELAMLLDRNRMASVTALTDGTVLVGDARAFNELVGMAPVHDRMAELIARRVAEITTPIGLTLRDGTDVLVRPLVRSDRATMEDLIAHQSDETLRRRFFSPGHPGARVVAHLVDINYIDHFAWGVTEPDGITGVGAARYVRLRDDPTSADLAFGIADEHHGKGLGTLLLGALAWVAADAGIEHFTAEVLADNLPMRAVLAKAGATSSMPSMGVVAVTLEVASAQHLVDEHTALRLRDAVHNVVTAAGLALVETEDPTPRTPLT